MSKALNDIERRDPGTLRPYAGNARTHSKKQARQIADSIERFGFTNPVRSRTTAQLSPATVG